MKQRKAQELLQRNQNKRSSRPSRLLRTAADRSRPRIHAHASSHWPQLYLPCAPHKTGPKMVQNWASCGIRAGRKEGWWGGFCMSRWSRGIASSAVERWWCRREEWGRDVAWGVGRGNLGSIDWPGIWRERKRRGRAGQGSAGEEIKGKNGGRSTAILLWAMAQGTSLLAACGGETVKLFDVSIETGDPCTFQYTPSPGYQVNCARWNHTSKPASCTFFFLSDFLILLQHVDQETKMAERVNKSSEELSGFLEWEDRGFWGEL